MPQAIHFHCVWVPADKVFRLSVGAPTHKLTPSLQRTTKPQSWDLLPPDFEEALKSAHDQLVDTTDATFEYHLDFPHGGITFNQGRDAFAAIIAYLQKVYDGWKRYQRNR